MTRSCSLTQTHSRLRSHCSRWQCHHLLNLPRYRSLQIFRDEAHASAHSRATKEGLSLFGALSHGYSSDAQPDLIRAKGIANLARTPLGKVKMRDWFLRPSLELDVIESRHDAVECFLREDNRASAARLWRESAALAYVVPQSTFSILCART